MFRTWLLRELRRRRLEEACGGWRKRRLTQEETAQSTGSEHTFRRHAAANRRIQRRSRYGFCEALAVGGGWRGNDCGTSGVRIRSTDHGKASCVAGGPLELAHRRDPQARRALRGDGVGRGPGGSVPGGGSVQPRRSRRSDEARDGALRPGARGARLRSRGSRDSALLPCKRRQRRRSRVSLVGGRVPSVRRAPGRHRGAGAVPRLRRPAGRDRGLRDAPREWRADSSHVRGRERHVAAARALLPGDTQRQDDLRVRAVAGGRDGEGAASRRHRGPDPAGGGADRPTCSRSSAPTTTTW